MTQNDHVAGQRPSHEPHEPASPLGQGEPPVQPDVEAASSVGASSAQEPSSVPAPDAELKAVRQELAQVKERYTRLRADLDNIQKRSRREVAEQVQRDKARMVRDWLEVVDGAERALSAAAEDDSDPWVVGTRGLHRLMLDVLRRHGVESIAPLDEPFDPNLHEALGAVPDEARPSGTVAYVQLTGYRHINGPVIRPAQVLVVQ